MESVGTPPHKKNGFTLLIISIALANFMASFDATIVTIALPTIAKEFSLSTSTVSWLITIYVLIMAGCVLIFGKLSDITGFKKVFLSGFFIFTLGSFACGFLPDFTHSFAVFIGSRAVQAIGAVMITAIGPAMVTAFIPMEQKGKAMGITFAFAALGMTIAPTIGGLLTQYLSWSWIFYINIPIGIIAIILGAKVIPGMEVKKRVPGFDRAGAVLICTGLASLLFTLSEGQVFGWTNPIILGSLFLALLTLCAFVWCEFNVSDPLLELRLLKQRNFLLTNTTLVLVMFINVGIIYLFPFYLQFVQGYSPSVAGLIFTSLPVATMMGGILAGLFYNRAGGRLINIIAGISIVSGYFLVTRIGPDTASVFMAFCLFLIGFGVGMVLTSASNMTMNSVSKKYQGMVSSFICLERFTPVTIGIALFNVVFILGMNAIAINSGVVKQALADIKPEVLVAGFDLAFLFGFIVSIILLVITALARQEIHPDYQKAKNEHRETQQET